MKKTFSDKKQIHENSWKSLVEMIFHDDVVDVWGDVQWATMIQSNPDCNELEIIHDFTFLSFVPLLTELNDLIK